jgi:ferrous iron transport protein B
MTTKTLERKTRTFKIAVAGNPNCGKTTLFNGLTGASQRIGNWPGVTVEKKTGEFRYGQNTYSVTDLPGIYALSAYSEDEQVARGYLLSGDADLVINIVDATNLERNLYLTSQLLEMRVPLIVVVNMTDLAEKRGIQVDARHLEKHLGCPVVAISAIRSSDIERVRQALAAKADSTDVPGARIEYPDEVEKAIEKLAPRLGHVSKILGANPRWTAVKLIEGDFWVTGKVLERSDLSENEITSFRDGIKKVLGESPDTLVADYRYGFAHGLVKDVVKRKVQRKAFTEQLDRVILSRVFGIPIFLAVMYAMFWVTINLGGAFIDFFDILFGTVFVDGFGTLLAGANAPEWLITFLADGVGAGIQTVSTFIPIIFTMFLMLSLLEDSGYMARAAFVMDRGMRWIGLPGKAFVPMLVGFGCTVPAIMATRTLENRKDRMLTALIAPFMSCGARLPVYALFAAAFFPLAAQNIVFSLYMVGITLAVLSGLLLKNTLFKGEPTPFIMELPPYHAPRLRHIMKHTWNRLRIFMFRAGKVIVAVVIVLGFLGSLGVDGTFGNEDSEDSVLARIGKVITPVFSPMGIEKDNWPASVALFTGLFAKEAVVGTVSALYSQIDGAAGESGEEEAGVDLLGGVGEAFASVPANLAGLGGTVSSPLGARVGEEIGDEQAAADELEVETGVFSALRSRFHSGAGAYAYLLFVLIYIPCVAVLGVAAREIGGGMTVFMTGYLTLLGWIVATLFFQLTVGGSLLWTAVPVALGALMVGGLVLAGKAGRRTGSPAPS